MLRNGIYLGQRYEILGRIGSGGMADVYKAKDHKLNRFVAIKVLKKEFRDDSKFVSKFRVEAQSAAGLMHPNIVNVYDVADEQGISYMVMELVEGITLKDYIERRGQLSAKEVISISIQVANGIEAAHKNHIVHRDIKPQNIIISREGKVKVTDFGIARAASANTISSNAMGSVHYTSPEQARGGYSDFKSDIYSLGITMYEMLTGRVPFDGDSTVNIAIKHLTEAMEMPHKYAPDVPRSLEQIVLKCCQKSPDRRYASMADLVGDLKQSLLNPNGDFVKIPILAGDATKPMTSREMEDYLNENGDTSYNGFYDEEVEEEYPGEDRGYRGNGYRQEPAYDPYDKEEGYEEEYPEEEPFNPYDGYPEDGVYDDGDGEVDHRMKGVMRVLLVIAAIIIATLIIFVAGKAVGVFKFGPSIGILESDENKVEVPSFLGMTYEQAQQKAAAMNLKVAEAGTSESDQYEEGLVTKQSVAEGKKVSEGTTIKLTISSGLTEEAMDVPDVTDKDQDEAEKELTKAGFKVKSTFEASDDIEAGKVISQSPDGGSQAGKGATITIVVSTGSDNAQVPTLTGMTQSEAKTALNEKGLSLGTVTEEYSDSYDAGVVIRQGTEAGTKAAKGSAVNIVISKGAIPLEDQVWQCNVSLTIPNYDNATPVTIILEQEGRETTIVSNEVVSNPYSLQTTGMAGVTSGVVTVYAEQGDGSTASLGSTTVTFSRVK